MAERESWRSESTSDLSHADSKTKSKFNLLSWFGREPSSRVGSSSGKECTKYSKEQLQSMVDKQQHEIDTLAQDIKSLKFEIKEKENEIKEKEKEIKEKENENDILVQNKHSQDMKTKSLEREVHDLKEDNRRMLERQEHLNENLNKLEEQAIIKEHDLSEYHRKVATLHFQLQERDDQLAKSKRKRNEIKTTMSRVTEECKLLQAENDELGKKLNQENDRYHGQEKELKKQIEELETRWDDKNNELSLILKKLRVAEMELQKQKEHTSKLTKDLEDRQINDTQFRREVMRIEEEKARLRKEMENMSMRSEKDKGEKENLLRMEADCFGRRIRELEQRIRESKQETEKLAEENQSMKRENENLKKLRYELEAQDKLKTKELADLKGKIAAVEVSSQTRQQMLQKEIDSLKEHHIYYMKKQEERHESEKKEMETQMEKFLQVLNDDKQVERETIQATIQQVAHTNAVTNQILQAAFRTFQRRYRPAANIRELDDDL